MWIYAVLPCAPTVYETYCTVVSFFCQGGKRLLYRNTLHGSGIQFNESPALLVCLLHAACCMYSYIRTYVHYTVLELPFTDAFNAVVAVMTLYRYSTVPVTQNQMKTSPFLLWNMKMKVWVWVGGTATQQRGTEILGWLLVCVWEGVCDHLTTITVIFKRDPAVLSAKPERRNTSLTKRRTACMQSSMRQIISQRRQRNLVCLPTCPYREQYSR